VKKLIFKLLCSKPVGWFIYKVNRGNIPCLRWKGFRFKMPKEYSSYMNHAAVFWGFYESAELRLINKHLSSELPVIELGGSLGIVSSHIISRIKQPYKIVEANPMLIETIRTNTSKYNSNRVGVEIINKAVSYSASTVSFAVSVNNTESSLAYNGETKQDNRNMITIPATTLSILTNDLSAYTLVCDIEGAEVELIKKDKAALTRCRYIFMEVHKTLFENLTYSQDDIIQLLQQQGFQLIIRDGHVIYMGRKNDNIS
jgi:FkbM family methyltransferase